MNEIADLRTLFGLMRRQVWTILAFAAAIFLLTLIVVFSVTPRYTAQALLLVDTSSKNLLDPDTASANGLTDNSRVESEVRIIQSDAVLLDVVRDGNLLSDPEFRPGRGAIARIRDLFGGETAPASESVVLGSVLASLKEAVRVRREGLTYLITVGVTSQDAEKAARLANLVTAAYVRNQVDGKVAGTIAARNSLQQRVSAAKQLLAEHENELDAFTASHHDLPGFNIDAAPRISAAGFGTMADGGSAVPSATVTQFYSLQQSSQIARAQYQNLLTRLQDFEAQATLQLADSRVVSQAMAPIDPSYPKTLPILAVMALVAVGIGLGAAFLREFFVGGFTGEDQVSAVLNIPLAAVVPHQEGSELDKPHGRGLSDTIITAPLSVFSESIRRIRVSVEQALLSRAAFLDDGQEQGIVIMVSSPSHQDGKSTLAASLARTYSRAGKRTLLIDCDLRKPSIHRHVDREPTPAFVNLLRGEPDPGLANIVVTDNATNLSVILGARPAEFPTDDLLMSPKIRALLSRARQHFDYVVIDTPPVDAAVDALYLARLCDAILFVVRWANTPQSVARKAVAELKANVRDGVPIVAVLNRQDQKKWLSFGGVYSPSRT
ncbi:Wzz/FepE/Etk N-terminal domain-containing protein [Rhizobium sp. S96]|uniref:Wzz/FepE/Etk N-terminal domain-containing protein n=1 Tax=Rhizobium sp. S96 TaxID=3055140 RepID=UPI0025AB04B2|nr:Wzz/FepE/Etk N-terminal domain-containing protein [Rhizobium sp. S96]MDM9622462.1 Wzz/FepE/Etk N-terminal domain-containing protein [Rhizobium sp. S96]